MVYTVFNPSGDFEFNASQTAASLGLLDVFSPLIYDGFTSDSEIGVFTEACNIAGLQNCTASCSNVSAVFSTPQTFHNCLVYPAVAALYVNGSLGSRNLADSLGINNESQPAQTAADITTTIVNCLLDSCGDNKHCEDDLKSNQTISVPLPFIPLSRFDICDYSAPFSYLNADIGGVGVSTIPISV